MSADDVAMLLAIGFIVGVWTGHCGQQSVEHTRALDANAGYYDQTTGEFKYGCEVEHDEKGQRNAN